MRYLSSLDNIQSLFTVSAVRKPKTEGKRRSPLTREILSSRNRIKPCFPRLHIHFICSDIFANFENFVRSEAHAKLSFLGRLFIFERLLQVHRGTWGRSKKNNIQRGIHFFEVSFPGYRKRCGNEVNLIQYQNHGLLQLLSNVLVQCRRKVQNRKAQIRDHQKYIAHFHDTPKLQGTKIKQSQVIRLMKTSGILDYDDILSTKNLPFPRSASFERTHCAGSEFVVARLAPQNFYGLASRTT